jgi:hypothetical protein
MSNIVEQVAAGALLFAFMAWLVAVGIGFVAFCDWLKDRLSGIPRIPKAQWDHVNEFRRPSMLGLSLEKLTHRVWLC